MSKTSKKKPTTKKKPAKRAKRRTAPKLSRTAKGKCGKTCRVRTKGLAIGEVRKRTSTAGHVYEIIRVR